MPEQNTSVDDFSMLISNHKDNHNKTKKKEFNVKFRIILQSNQLHQFQVVDHNIDV